LLAISDLPACSPAQKSRPWCETRPIFFVIGDILSRSAIQCPKGCPKRFGVARGIIAARYEMFGEEGQQPMATLKDISRELGLSVTQVSRALNGHADVSEETRSRVAAAAKKLKYHPNLTARKLVSGKSGMVGLVLPRYPRMATDSNFFEIVAGLSAQFSNRGMQFVLHIANEADDIIDVYRRLLDGGALDGFVLVEPVVDDPRIRFLRERGANFVLHGRTESKPNYPYYDIDNQGAAYTLTRYLIDLGHRDIGFINGLAGRCYAQARFDGYRAALTEAGLPFREKLVSNGRMRESLGMISTVQMFSGNGTPPTAMIANNTLIAKGIYDGLQALGLSVPNDVSVVAHDDDLPGIRAQAFFPALTVTHSPMEASWSPLAEFLSGAIDGKPLEALQKISPIAFIARNSTAPPPHRR
jgi:LacI family transcriptional regulator